MKISQARSGLPRSGAPQQLDERRRRLGKALRASRQYHRALMENANDAICIVASDSTILEANRAAEELHGRARRDIVGKSFLELLAPEERNRVLERFGRMLVNGSDHDSVLILRDGDEKIRVEVSASRVVIGGELLTLAIIRDVSERERAAEALAASERKYRELIENAPIGIYRSTRDGRFLDANAAFARELGYETVEEVLALDLRTDIYWNPDDRERMFSESERLGGTAAFEVQLKRKDGAPLWVRLDSRTIRDRTGKTLYCEGFVKDIGERKWAEQRLLAFSNLGRKLSSAETAQEAAEVVANCADELWRWDACTVDLYDGERDLVESLFNVDVLDGCRQAIPPSLAGAAPSPRQRRVLKEGALCIAPDRAPRESNSIPFGDCGRLSLSILIAPIRRGDAVTGFLSVQSYRPDAYGLADLEVLQSLADFCGGAFARIQTAERLKGSRERLRALSRRLIEAQEIERSRLARELHDEIGQALTAVKINLQGARASEEGVEFAARIADSLEIVERTMHQVRDISIALRPSLLDDVGLVAALRWYLVNQAQRAGFTAHFEAVPPSVQLPPDLAIACYRVVQEAVTNVARHAAAREVRVRLTVGEREARIEIRDDGVGFDVAGARERSRSGGSFGILSMTERVRLLGGRLEIDSAPGRGTEIRARFPLEAPNS